MIKHKWKLSLLLILFTVHGMSRASRACDSNLTYLDQKLCHYREFGESMPGYDNKSDFLRAFTGPWKPGSLESQMTIPDNWSDSFPVDWSHNLGYLRSQLANTSVSDVIARYKSSGIIKPSDIVRDLLRKKALAKKAEIIYGDIYVNTDGTKATVDAVSQDENLDLVVSEELNPLIIFHYYYLYYREMAIQVACWAATNK